MTTVQLWAGTIPYLSYIASHYWIVEKQNGYVARWEVWQLPNQCSSSWGHLHKNLMNYNAWLPGQKKWLEKEWHGKTALQLSNTLASIDTTYPHRSKYRYFPGPNSNSFIQWVLNESAANHQLPPHAIGKDHQQALFMGKRDTSWQLYTPFLAFKSLPTKGVEFTLLGAGFGVSIQPFKITSPLTTFHQQVQQ